MENIHILPMLKSHKGFNGSWVQNGTVMLLESGCSDCFNILCHVSQNALSTLQYEQAQPGHPFDFAQLTGRPCIAGDVGYLENLTHSG